MIKWSEFREGDVLYEALLPEHEREGCEWLVRASCRGHILAERHETLTWRPRFGPDAGDVAVLEAIAAGLARQLQTIEVPHGDGPYVPLALPHAPPGPLLQAVRYALVAECARAEAALGITKEQMAAYLSLPIVAHVGGLYPFAVTPDRDLRMRRLIVLEALIERDGLQAHRETLLAPVLAFDIQRLRAVLLELGPDIEGT